MSAASSITQEMSVPEILAKFPQTEPVFRKHGIQAEGYKALAHENLFATARVHQLDLQHLLGELNGTLGH
ncbi:MAG: hypothetical protein VKJ04_07890 [Vampirovibrionales bacterium]|nr:hypothetical protein [Vampirovibrionales bacterium]